MRLPVRAVVALAAAGGLALAASGVASAATPPVVPVAHVDLTKYLGDWHQVAAIPAIYELPCTGNSNANYSLAKDGNVQVRNSCDSIFGGTYKVVGEAKLRDAVTNAQLEVSFLNLLGFQFFFGSTNYVIISLDAAYSVAVVASPDHGSAFVLSRAPKLTPTQTTVARAALKANGIDPCALKTTPTTGGTTTSAAFC